jgi:uncharacterized protein with FMN-binding domain
MRKTLVIIFAVAVLGGMSIYVNKHKDSDSSTVTAQPSSSQTDTSSAGGSAANSSSGSYKDGTYSGSAAETPYGTVQVAAVISGGKITDVKFLRMPDDEQHSVEVTQMAESTLSNQSADGLDMVTGATSTYYGYQESLQAALNKAKLT